MALCRCRLPFAPPFGTFGRVARPKHQRRHCVNVAAAETRRAVLLSLGILTTSVTSVSQAQENGKGPTEVSTGTKELRSAAGFKFVYPSSWLVAFERGDSMKEGTIAFVGNFLTVDTFSVEKKFIKDIPSEKADLVFAAEDIVQPVQQSPSSISFERIDAGYTDPLQGQGSLYVVEYNVDTCKGLVSESLGGKKACKDAKDNDLITVPRHHLVAVTKTDDALYILRGSCPSNRWDAVKGDLVNTMNSFVTFKTQNK